MKILTLVGARPQFIKEAVVGEALRAKGFDHVLVHTGQHYDLNMSKVFFDKLKIKEPDFNLSVGSGSHAEQTGNTMIKFEKVVYETNPDIIIVYGDTNSTLAGALVSAKLKIPLAHVEAGLRQEPKDMPEEINRVVTDRLSQFRFCPTKIAVNNLKNEGISEGVWFTGDVMYDLYKKLECHFDYSIINELSLKKEEYVVCTIHRDFNTDNKKRLTSILKQLQMLSQEKEIVFPIHPRTAKRIEEFDMSDILNSFTVIEPIDYLKMMALVKNSWKVITDSGGLQKESYFAGKKVIVVMPDTSWSELIDAGAAKLTEPEHIYESISTNEKDYIQNEIYGNGKAAKKIADILERTYDNLDS